MLRQATLVLLGLPAVLATAAAAPATTYTVTDLGTLGTGLNSFAMSVNDSGMVAGATNTNGHKAASTQAAIYSGGAWTDIGAAINSTGQTFANAINDAGQVALWNRTVLPLDSYIYNTNTRTYTDIAAQPGVCNGFGNSCGCDTYFNGGDYTNAAAINSSGEIVGLYYTTRNSNGDPNGFVWNGSSTVDVPTPAGFVANTYASGINNSGVIVGAYAVGASPTPTGYYYNGAEHDINNMNYPQSIYGNEVVGAVQAGSSQVDAAIYTLGASSATDIGGLPGADQSMAYGVSSNGTVVGFSYTSTAQVGIVYSNGVMTDLNTLISGPDPFSVLNQAMAISANGEYIVGDGTIVIGGTAYTQGFLLTAVASTPEPSTLLLAASGLFGLVACAWRKRK
jgi:probable HAF family extracellular repeat protein